VNWSQDGRPRIQGYIVADPKCGRVVVAVNKNGQINHLERVVEQQQS